MSDHILRIEDHRLCLTPAGFPMAQIASPSGTARRAQRPPVMGVPRAGCGGSHACTPSPGTGSRTPVLGRKMTECG